MKKTLLTLLSVLFCAISFAQSVPQGLNYQAIARDASGDVFMNQALTIQFSVISDITTSAISWQETQSVTTNDYGLFTAIIGQGTSTNVGSSATFYAIDWGASNHLLKVEIDYGSGFVDMGTTPFMSVPYSLHAKTAANGSTTDELQTLIISGDTISISNGNFVVLDIECFVAGCTDSNACNYNSSACYNNGSCDYYFGCIDATAFNYDVNAICDDGTCIAVVNGCTDSTATNYDPLANTDDGTCELDNCSLPSEFVGNTGSNMTVLLQSSFFTDYPQMNDAYIVATSESGLVVGSIYFGSVDGSTSSFAVWGDDSLTPEVDGALSGESFTLQLVTGVDLYDISTEDLSYSTNGLIVLSSSSLTLNCSGGETDVLGCTDEAALNYDSLATTDNGSCVAVVSGCTDSTAYSGYNPLANTDDGSCIAVVNGCTDSTATNYNPLANTDDGSCIVGLSIGDTYQGGIVFWLDGNGGGLIAAPTDQSTLVEWGCNGTSMSGADGTAIGTGAQNTLDIEAGCTTAGTAADICANLTLGGYSDWFLPSKYELQEMNLNSNIINTSASAIGGTDLIYLQYYWSSTEFNSNNAVALIFGHGTPLWNDPKNLSYKVRPIRAFGTLVVVNGCMDALYTEYNAAANANDGTCATLVVVNGCTNPTALNYNALANTDDGTCNINGCTFTLTMTDSYGDTWNGGTLTINGVTYDQPTTASGGTSSGGASDTYTLCVDLSTCIDVTYSAGSYSYENSWSISDASGTVLALGGDVSGQFGACPFFGCTDSTATNYNALATIDDGSCIPFIYGCIDASANNYDPLANTDDGSCIINGCTDETAPNYNAEANTDDGSCIINGCTDETAPNYNAEANTDDGTCIINGCTDSTASNYDPLANTNDGSCIINGCTDSTAINYNASANFDDGSCIAVVLGCTDSTATNYNAAADTDDGSCIAVVNGCTDSTAYSGYNPLANTDDGSCIAVVLGCTDANAFNYDASANTDDGSCLAVVSGCTDSLACNYDASANTDSVTCTYAATGYDCAGACLLDEVTLTMTDSYGDTWNGGTLTINGVTYDQPTTGPSSTGASDTYTLCVDLSTCIDVIYSAGSYSGENSWSISDASGAVLASAGNASGTVGNGCPVYGCTDSTATNYDPLANTDDGSCCFNGICIGSTYQGGIIFYILQPGDIGYVAGQVNGLIAATSDQSTGTNWGCYATNVPGAEGTAIGTGQANTNDIEAGCGNSGIAADICANLTLGGYSDWFLPSKDELNQMYLNIGQGSSLGNPGGFATYNGYWSSTEYSIVNAWAQDFNEGYQLNGSKNSNGAVRAVRAF